MNPKLIFLGTGGARFVVNKQLRATGGIILQYEDEQIHIDPGPGALIRAKQYGVDLEKNTAVLVSHNHPDHCNDMNAVIDTMTMGGIKKRGTVIGNITVIKGSDQDRPYLTTYHEKCAKKVFALEPGKSAEINNIKVLATKAKHDTSNAIGFRVITPKFTLGYTSDTEWFRGIENEYKGCDVMIMNVQKPKKDGYKGHLTSQDAVKFLKKVNPKLAIIQHFGRGMLQSNPLYEARDIQRESGVQTIAATDGVQIDPLTYSSKASQKTLGGY